MKKTIINILKIFVPLGLGLYLCWFMYDSLSEKERQDLFDSFKNANYFWLGASLILSFLGHASRAYRWKYLLEPMGYKPKFKNMYHALMVGYIVNLTIPRSGEASRAGVLLKKEGIPFDKSFGTIVAERAVDLLMLGIVFIIALILQYENFDLIKAEILDIGASTNGEPKTPWILYIFLGLIALGIIGALFIWFKKPALKNKIIGFIKGIIEGGMAIFKSKHKWAFIGHTIFIWASYIGMFAICFQALESTADISFSIILAAFIGGSIGIIVTPGGIGSYTLLVGSVINLLVISEGDGNIGHNIGWLIWVCQTVLMVTLGVVSLIAVFKKTKKIKNAS